MIGRLHGLVLDCPVPRELAKFYQHLLGLDKVIYDDESWVTLEGSDPGSPTIGFQQVTDFRAAQWPDPSRPQQAHIDVMVPDLDVAEALVLAQGATLLRGSDKPIGFRVYADPVGHPFCLVTPESIVRLEPPGNTVQPSGSPPAGG